MCGENSYFDEEADCCICVDGHMLNPESEICEKIPACPPNSYLLPNGVCECVEGYYYDMVTGDCASCG